MNSEPRFSQFGGRSFIPIAERMSNQNGPESAPMPASFDADPGTMDFIPIPFDPTTLRQREIERILEERRRVRLIPVNLQSGCFRVVFTPNSGSDIFHGTLRVDRTATETTISGDLYRYAVGATVPSGPDIPIFPRRNYFSYLKVTDSVIGFFQVTLTVEEYQYTHPMTGFNGSFADVPTRTFRIVLFPATRPVGFGSPYFRGRVYEADVERGVFEMGWVSSFFRKATVEIDTVAGAVAPPTSVPASSGSGTESFRTIYATAGWDLNVIYDATAIPVPAGITATECCLIDAGGPCTNPLGWSGAQLHNLMTMVRRSTPTLDEEWRVHLMVVQAKLGCSRGLMYDQIVDHREGAATYSDDGYPSTDSAFYGTAADQQQRNVPRAYLRSAAHEIGHCFNGQHQGLPGEAASDNSIMTPTNSVARILGTATTGATGVFPTNIALEFNAHVRHHMVHFPDPVVRPGAMNWTAGHSTSAPEADVDFFDASVLELELVFSKTQVKLGELLPLAWELVNHSSQSIPVPNDLRLEVHQTEITIIDPSGITRRLLPFVIFDYEASRTDLKPGEKLEARTRLFWSSNGFAFDKPGKHIIEVRILWNEKQKIRGVKASKEIWVDYPVINADNDVAALLLHDEVGMFVALGGRANHLKEAVSRIREAISKHPNHPASKRMAELLGQ